MNEEFGGPFHLTDDTGLAVADRPEPQAYTAWVKQQLNGLRADDPAILRMRRPRPTAAFSPQDTTHADYVRVREEATAAGFEPIERGTGGRLTMFDGNALAITLVAPHHEPHRHMMQRYEQLSAAIAAALADLGIAARVGELANEYCPGKFSINASGRVKLVGVAQRMNSRCYQMGAIIAVFRSDAACAAIADAYRTMGLPFDPATYGAMADFIPSLTYEQASDAFSRRLGELLSA